MLDTCINTTCTDLPEEVKLGFINERPEHNRDARWSETVRANPLSLSSSTLVGFGSEVDLGLASWL